MKNYQSSRFCFASTRSLAFQLGFIALFGLSAASCGTDDEGGAAPQAPSLGRRIDRAGRVAITAALIETFGGDADRRTDNLDGYNRSSIGNANFLPTMQISLAILDGLDGECGNQLLYDGEEDAPYGGLASTLLDDRLYVNRSEAGSVYLGVEAEAAVPGFSMGAAGGRQPGDDTIARSYSVLAAGALSGIDDGIESDDEEHDPDNFPFLAAP